MEERLPRFGWHLAWQHLAWQHLAWHLACGGHLACGQHNVLEMSVQSGANSR